MTEQQECFPISGNAQTRAFDYDFPDFKIEVDCNGITLTTTLIIDDPPTKTGPLKLELEAWADKIPATDRDGLETWFLNLLRTTFADAEGTA